MFPDLKIWLNHFEYHAEHPRCIPDGLSNVLRPEERRLIADSIATFQLGEESDGGSLRWAAQRFGEAHGAPALSRITELLIREEQRHATLLRAFMGEHYILPKRRDWTDRVFRRVRRMAGFELYLNVLIAAELIGNVYYRALEVATGCQRLKVLCRTLVADELAHVGFESELLLALRASKPALTQSLSRITHRAFFNAAATVVWLTHRRVLRRAGYYMGSFLRACNAQYDFHLAPAPVKVPTTLTS
jgi:hypothetical protein